MHHRLPSRRTVLTTAAATAVTAVTAGSFAAGIPAAEAAAPDRRMIRAIIARMSRAEKVGQLFVMRVYGHSATAPDPADAASNQSEMGVSNAAELIAKYHLGGIIYFAWAHNTRDPHQIAGLSNGIQRAGLTHGTPIPLLISTDQEQGAVARIGSPATLFPGGMALGADGDPHDARAAAHVIGTELGAIGVNQNFSPVSDVNINPANPVIGVRSFGADPQAVAALTAAQVKGYQGAGIASTAKHFPGHGDTGTDSHFELPVITHSLEEWRRIDAPPFRAAIAAGIDSIMTAHILVPALDDSGDPATLSRPILTGILREELGYDGVVITDSLGMAGVRQKYGDDRVPVLALKAGADQLLNPPLLDVAWNAVLDAVKSGEISERRIDESLVRILELKARNGLFRNPYVTHQGVDRAVGIRSHRATADRITDRTVTLLTNRAQILPLPRRAHRNLLVVGADPAAPSGTGGPPTAVLAEALTGLGHPAQALPTGTAPGQALIDRAVAAALGKDGVIVATYNVTAAFSGQIALVKALVATGVPVVQIAIRNPYDIAWLSGVAAGLAVYGWTDVSLRAVARVIAGRAAPVGRLPVAVPRADDPKQVLYPIGHGLRFR
ncbi:glycoside hydrolase family 3 protein [Streptomyces sp. H10-C2]|uniref:glycoside hydrolase family 3 protein n=1 Tax=unclassified Streptomyces TaxID=2593676 RepID=UPI0024BBE137|nr:MULTISPECIES: glycoside hydrolase family 3 protein [unclassified Streptomyces]MDJ0340043.1 glycoside hydrolase family 3 protein [Streptomyces sp. PH10-H1]MDJ0369320.1 glycoside hydrolase family 3 protein [Streptomyces sp. H10-C2]